MRGRSCPPDAKSKPGDAFFQEYERKLERATSMAFIANVMYGLNWFLGFCALTWASTVILGGLLSYLTQNHYYSVVALLLLEAVRLSTVTFFGKFVTWKLVHGSADPLRLVYNDVRRQKLQGIARILEQAVQLTVITISILVPIRRLDDLNFLAGMRSHLILAENFNGLETSLYIFYLLVLLNGAIAGLLVIFFKNVVPFFVDSFSLRKYYEKIVWKGMDQGLLHATDFELLSWMFQIQADEYRRNTRALVVRELYGDMILFLYYYPKYKGFEAAKVALESDDTFEREAAANIVGLWASLAAEVEESGDKGAPVKGEKADGSSALASALAEAKEADNEGAALSANVKKLHDKRALARLLIQTKLLAKLAEALDSDESGRAASLSFEKLAKIDPEGVLMVRSEEKDEKVADILMDRIHRTVELGKPNNALIYIKTMIPLLSYLIESHELHNFMLIKKSEEEMTAGNGHGIGKYCMPPKLWRLKEDMWTIVSEYASGLKRLQTVAAHMYCLLQSEDERKGCKGEELRRHLMEKPKRKSHILKNEQEMFLTLPGVIEWPSGWEDVLEVRQPRNMESLPWLARPTMAWIATLVTLIILSVSSIYLTHF